MQNILQELRVSNAGTYILDADNKEITTKQINTGYWVLAYDRDGTCFEMYKINRDKAKDYLEFNDADFNFKNLDITDFGTARYYWTENACDTGVLRVL
tara:strand:+ start:192 stop:485 length:294 start_codon:yes stop_codon:yes gene_type:complete